MIHINKHSNSYRIPARLGHVRRDILLQVVPVNVRPIVLLECTVGKYQSTVIKHSNTIICMLRQVTEDSIHRLQMPFTRQRQVLRHDRARPCATSRSARSCKSSAKHQSTAGIATPSDRPTPGTRPTQGDNR
jgi:hypothetical protein